METIIAALKTRGIPFRITSSGRVRLLGGQRAQIGRVRNLYLLTYEGSSVRLITWFTSAEGALRAALGEPLIERAIGRVEASTSTAGGTRVS